MRNKDFDKLLKEAIILDAEEQGARIEPCSEPIPEAAQARFDAALNGTRRKSKKTIADASSEQPQPVKRAHRWLAYGLTAVSAAAVILVVALLIGTGGLRGTKPQEPVMPAEQQPMQAETTMEPLPELGEQEPEPVEIRVEDLEGVWREWTPDNVDVGYRLTLFRDGTAKMVYQIPLSGEQTIEGTYSVKNGITVTFGDETMQAVYDPESDALLLFESETSWLTLYRNPDTYMIEHWFEMQRKPLLKKTVAMEDLFGVWTLERAESAFSSFDLSGLSGYLSIEQGSFRIGMRLAGEDHSASLACSVIDSVLTETGTYYGVRAIVDPDTGLLKLSLVFFDRELTAADLVLVFRKLSVFQWQGYDCLIPEGFVSAYESDREFLAATEKMNDRDLFLMAYELRPEADLSNWDSNVFSKNHLKTLLSAIGAQADYADFTGVLNHAIDDGIVCYHLYNNAQRVYACIVKVFSDGENGLVMAGMTMGEPGIDAFDGIANAIVTLHTGEQSAYRLIVNGQEVPVDSVFREYAKGEIHLMIPVTALFRGIGCETEVRGDKVLIKRDGSIWLVLDLNAHTLINPDKPWYNYFTLAPGDTGSDFKRQRSGDELWVCTAYVENAFQILGIPERAYYDERNNEMRVTIGSTDG